MYEQTAISKNDPTVVEAEHVTPPELPKQDFALEDSVGQFSRVKGKLELRLSM